MFQVRLALVSNSDPQIFNAQRIVTFSTKKELIDWFSDQRTDVSYAYTIAGVYGICSLASSWIIAPLMYWNMTDGHNFRTQGNCFKSRMIANPQLMITVKTC